MKKPEETIEILTKEIESLNSIEAHDLVLFYYKINHEHYNITTYDKFNEFLESFDKNPFNNYMLVNIILSTSVKNSSNTKPN